MAFKISTDCIACGSCLPECAAEAISEGTEYYTIDAEACIDCGACADACPVGAISEL
ncbi:MAG: 4Fe-4S binding protein [Bacillota bacterium]|mgnify:CR=1 FL=1|jgi:ferredoxin|nr:4Fe-4S binding protein [Bacillota bacterium]HHT89520.1 4Fe-4S binding protein [Bacillota bacterium]